MHNTVLFIFILAILGGCAGSPDSPASTRVDCPDDLYLPAHKPDECGQEAPAEISVKHGTLDSLVGTYRTYNKRMAVSGILRIYADGGAINASWGTRDAMRWEKKGNQYDFFAQSGEYHYSARLQSVRDEPDLVSFGTKYFFGMFDGIKLSDDPDYLFDLYKVGCKRQVPNSPCYQTYESRYKKDGLDVSWQCINIGQLLSTDLDGIEYLPGNLETPRDYGNTESACQAICERAVSFRFGAVGAGNCLQ